MLQQAVFFHLALCADEYCQCLSEKSRGKSGSSRSASVVASGGIAMIASAGISILITAFEGDGGENFCFKYRLEHGCNFLLFPCSYWRKTCISPILVMILAGGMKLFTSMLL